MLVMGIETSCDETSVAIVEDGRKIHSNIILSQIDKHAKFGGVVPELAARSHLEVILQVIEAALDEAGLLLGDIELIAGTYGPGLIGGLLVGLSMAKTIALARQVPFIGVNHVEGHIYANFLTDQRLTPPLLCLTVSGGHTNLVYMPEFTKYQVMGQTRDDAAGEAFDKVARVLGLGYPGGPYVDELAVKGEPVIELIHTDALAQTYDFSFSGIKTAVVNLVNSYKQKGMDIPRADLAASFQEYVVSVLTERSFRAAERLKVKTVLLSGGVAANSRLRQRFASLGKQKGITICYPPLELCTDNAAMIAACGFFRYQRLGPSDLGLPADPRLKLV